MNFKAVSNDKLISELKLRVENERKLLMEILHALREVEIRKLHLEMGYPDLYEFAMKELGYSAGAAYRRISAMRLLQAMPEIAPRLENGELGIENASQAQSFFRKEDQRRRETGELKLTLEEKQEVVAELFGKSTREGQRVLMNRSPEVMTPSEKLRPLPEQKTLVQFVASAELMEKLEALKHLLAHKNYEGRMDILIEQLADLALNKLKPKAAPTIQNPLLDAKAESSHSIVSTNQKIMPVLQHAYPSPAPGIEKRSRYIPASERRKVLLRDQNGCTYKDAKSGRTCQSQHGLQFDHVVPFSQGGQNTAANLTLRCGAHNRYRAYKVSLLN